MPITQERMLQVIASGNAWRSALEAVEKDLKMLIMFRAQGEISEDDLIARLRILVRENTPPLGAVENLATEARYFAKYAHRNSMARQRSSKYRFSDGVASRSTAPDRPTMMVKKKAAKHAPEVSLDGTLDKATRDAIMAEVGREQGEKLLRNANPDVKAANLAPPLPISFDDL